MGSTLDLLLGLGRVARKNFLEEPVSKAETRSQELGRQSALPDAWRCAMKQLGATTQGQWWGEAVQARELHVRRSGVGQYPILVMYRSKSCISKTQI